MVLAASGNDLLGFVLPMVGLMALMYFFLIMPQKKKEKKNREMINALVVGDSIVTIGGVSGKIINIKDDEITIETSVMKTQILVKKWSIREVVKPIAA
jgi:preprotein translocase subunit YajC